MSAPSQSPAQSPSQQPRRGGETFAEIIPLLEKGYRVRRIEWPRNVYVSMERFPDGLTLCVTGMEGGDRAPHPLILRDGDLFSDDWVREG